MLKTDEKQKISLDVDRAIYQRCKKIAIINHSTISQEIRKFLDKYAADNSQLALQT